MIAAASELTGGADRLTSTETGALRSRSSRGELNSCVCIIALLIQAASGVLSGPDPAQMEKAPDLGYRAVPAASVCPRA